MTTLNIQKKKQPFSIFSQSFLESDLLVKIRLGVYTAALLHLSWFSLIMYQVDFLGDEDPIVQKCEAYKYKLLTVWFHILSFPYLQMSIYCEWKALKGNSNQPHIKVLNFVRHMTFSSILFPVVAASDILFWKVWNKDRLFIAPVVVDRLVPLWTHHCMHTISLVVVVVDLILGARSKPKSLKLQMTLLALFLAAYGYVFVDSYLDGVYIYPGVRKFSPIKLSLLLLFMVTEIYFYYFSQWLVTKLFWGSEYVSARKITHEKFL